MLLVSSSGYEGTGALAGAVVVVDSWDLVGPWLGCGNILFYFYYIFIYLLF